MEENTKEEVKRPSINIADIAQCVEVLKVCTERGAWKPNELSAVGALYDKLNKFLEDANTTLAQKNTESDQG